MEFKEMTNHSDLIESVDELTNVMVVHAKYLERHQAAMENLTHAITNRPN